MQPAPRMLPQQTGNIMRMKKRYPVKTVYYINEQEDEFSSVVIEKKRVDEDWEYAPDGFWWRVKRFVFYRLLACPIGLIFCKIKFGWRVKNRGVRIPEKRGCFLYANHTQTLGDPFFPTFAMRGKSTFTIVHANNISLPVLGRVNKYLGALPLPDTLQSARRFIKAIEKRFDEGNCIAIYPEAHIWPYYIGIRNFPAVSFRYPVEKHAPCFVLTTTYQTRKFFKKPRAVSYLDGPYYPDETLPKKARVQDLRDRVYAQMKERSKNNTCEYIRYTMRERE